MSKLWQLETVYVLTGLVLLIFAGLTWRDRQHPRRFGSTLFWFVLALIFMLGGVLPHWLTGVLVVVLVGLDGAGQVSKNETVESVAAPVLERALAGNRIFLPVLAIPAVTFGLALAFRWLGQDANRGALLGLGVGSLAAWVIALRVTSSTPLALFEAGRKLNETMGAVNILPQLLASLGVIMAAAKVGDLIAYGIKSLIPGDHLFALVLANCAGMALFTMVMGNSFAAFPVLAAGVLVPLIIQPFGVDPALAAIITLTAGSSGTLMTPMAANFNIVPAALLNMKDQNGVIKFQLPYALTLWLVHVVLLWGLIVWFR